MVRARKVTAEPNGIRCPRCFSYRDLVTGMGPLKCNECNKNFKLDETFYCINGHHACEKCYESDIF